MILIDTIPHDKQRYETAGDWFDVQHPDGRAPDTKIAVSDVGNPDYEFCIAVHELIECYLCKRAGITTDMVDQFDFQFERERKEGHRRSDEEPGDCIDAPYHLQHQFATRIEKLLAAQLGLDWSEYDKAVQAL